MDIGGGAQGRERAGKSFWKPQLISTCKFNCYYSGLLDAVKVERIISRQLLNISVRKTHHCLSLSTPSSWKRIKDGQFCIAENPHDGNQIAVTGGRRSTLPAFFLCLTSAERWVKKCLQNRVCTYMWNYSSSFTAPEVEKASDYLNIYQPCKKKNQNQCSSKLYFRN